MWREYEGKEETKKFNQLRSSTRMSGDNVLLTVPGLLGTDVTVDDLSEVRGESDEGRSSVDSSTSVFQFESLISELDLFKLNLPVSLATNGDIVNVSSVVSLVDSTEYSFTLFWVGTEPEGENGVVEKTLVDHVVERRNDVLDRDSVVSETEDTV